MIIQGGRHEVQAIIRTHKLARDRIVAASYSGDHSGELDSLAGSIGHTLCVYGREAI